MSRDSCSDESSGESHYGKATAEALAPKNTTATAKKQQGSASGEGSVSAKKAQTRATPVPVAPTARKEAPKPPSMGPDDNKPTQRKADTVDNNFNVTIGYNTLQKTKGQGKYLELTGADKTLILNHSNADHKIPEAHADGDLDFPVSIDAHIKQPAVIPLRVTTQVPAMLDEEKNFPHGVHIAEDSITAETPYGLIALDIPKGETKASYHREVTAAQTGFIDQFPGQTASNVGNFVHKMTSHNNPNSFEYIVQAKEPKAAVVYFYNQHKDVKGTDRELTNENIDKLADKKGRVYVSDPVGIKAMDEAIETTKKTIKARIGYANVSNKATSKIRISGAPQVELDHNMKPTTSTPLLTHALRNSPAFKDNQQKGNITALARMEQSVLNGTDPNAPKFSIAGGVTYGYHKVTPNFKLIVPGDS